MAADFNHAVFLLSPNHLYLHVMCLNKFESGIVQLTPFCMFCCNTQTSNLWTLDCWKFSVFHINNAAFHVIRIVRVSSFYEGGIAGG